MTYGFGLCAVLLLVNGSVAEAREFSFKSNSKAAYFRGSFASNIVHQDAFSNSSGSVTLDDEETKSSFGGEFGALYSIDGFNFRLGIEALRPTKVEVIGRNGAGASLYTLTSEIFAWGPALTVEYVYSALQSVRFFTFAGVAYNYVSLDNHYEMTAAGTAFFSPVGTHTEKGGTTVVSSFFGAGLETMFADNATLALDFGYRIMEVTGYKHKYAGPSIAEGLVVKGAPLLNANAADRRTDLSGLTASLAFRFYIDL